MLFINENAEDINPPHFEVKALNTTSEELFATNHLKEPNELLDEIQNKIPYIAGNPIKLDILYNVVTSLYKE